MEEFGGAWSKKEEMAKKIACLKQRLSEVENPTGSSSSNKKKGPSRGCMPVKT